MATNQDCQRYRAPIGVARKGALAMIVILSLLVFLFDSSKNQKVAFLCTTRPSQHTQLMELSFRPYLHLTSEHGMAFMGEKLQIGQACAYKYPIET